MEVLSMFMKGFLFEGCFFKAKFYKIPTNNKEILINMLLPDR